MTITGVGSPSTYVGSNITNLTTQLNTLSQQLSTGTISQTYAGDGSGRSVAIAMRAQVASIAAYGDTQTMVNTSIGVMNLSLQQIASLGSTVKSAALSNSDTIDNNGLTPGQETAVGSLTTAVDALNAQSGNRYLFSGRAIDTAPVAPASQILNGNGAGIAGLKQVIAERLQADLGTGNNGRVSNALGANTTSVVLTEQDPTPALPATATPFGMKLTSISTSISGATVTQPAAPPTTESMSIDLGTATVNNGDTVTATMKMPDGTSENITLTASTTTPTPAGSFAIGTTPAQTASNLNAAMTTAISNLANGAMTAASAVQAGNEFFDEPPMRVSGTAPFGSATTLTAGTSANTVMWYQGEPDSASDPARGTAVAQVGQGTSVQYGARADEQALRTQVQSIAVYAAFTTLATNTNATAQLTALNQRVAQNLNTTAGQQTIPNMEADIANSQVVIKQTSTNQTQLKNIAQTMLSSIEGVDNNEVATKITALQTSLQASYQVTAQLYQLNLAKILSGAGIT